MGTKPRCPSCGEAKNWKTARGSLKCSACRREWRPGRLPLALTRGQWKRVAHCFSLGLSCNRITEETGLERKRVLRALTHIRQALLLERHEAFTGVVEVDETYVGGQRRNLRQAKRTPSPKRGRGTSKTPVFGILCRQGKVWAEVVPDIHAETLLPLISKRVKPGATVCSDTFTTYTGVAARGYVHRLVNHKAGTYSDKRGSHINGLEGFWGYLKRGLASRGGIRREKLPLFLGEYVWRYNHRKDPIFRQVSVLLKLLYKHKTISAN